MAQFKRKRDPASPTSHLEENKQSALKTLFVVMIRKDPGGVNKSPIGDDKIQGDPIFENDKTVHVK